MSEEKKDPTASYSQLDWPDSRVRKTYFRNGFISTIEEHAKKVIDDLVKLFPAFERLGLPPSWDAYCFNLADRPGLPGLKEFNERLNDWAIGHNLFVLTTDGSGGRHKKAADWCRELGCETLLSWQRLPFSVDVARAFGFERLGWSGAEPSHNLPTPPGEWPQYNPLRDRRQRYLEKLHLILEEALNHPTIPRCKRHGFLKEALVIAKAYCLDVEKHYIKLGYVPSKSRPSLLDKMNNAVEYQINEQPYLKVAGDSKSDVGNVKRAIDEVLNEIGLAPRNSQQLGRSKGERDSKQSRHTVRS